MDGTFSPEPEPMRVPFPNRNVVPSAVLGTLIFVVAEVMFFSGAISAFTISRANQLPGMWPPPGQPRLPASATALNTLALLASGALLLVASRQWKHRGSFARWTYLASWLLGLTFVALQGREWLALLSEGLTLTSSTLGSFFYLIVGGHALHALVALAALGWGGLQLWQGRLSRGWFFGTQTFWYFVVAMWPVIYARVYF
jgi:heme/copper-type cytochrome/quinol oxidase subunit 3